ncbi:MAG: DUF721 domain-containing protein [gamma proteobacterium symbiont of Bathyaustriella thionipta]|nr:DUF721 domain-containing protein [gamma proteobacterium symbiont of Bathyaustriella thionipta]
MSNKPKSFKAVTHQNGHLARLMQQATQQKALTEKLRQLLPQPFKQLLSHALLRDSTLVLMCPSQTVSSQLRLRSHDLLRQLQASSLPQITDIVCRTIPATGTHRKMQQHSQRFISQSAHSNLQRLAMLLQDENEKD